MQSDNKPRCPRCREDSLCLGDSTQADVVWFLCPTCRHAWVRDQAASVARPPHDSWRLDRLDRLSLAR